MMGGPGFGEAVGALVVRVTLWLVGAALFAGIGIGVIFARLAT